MTTEPVQRWINAENGVITLELRSPVPLYKVGANKLIRWRRRDRMQQETQLLADLLADLSERLGIVYAYVHPIDRFVIVVGADKTYEDEARFAVREIEQRIQESYLEMTALIPDLLGQSF